MCCLVVHYRRSIWMECGCLFLHAWPFFLLDHRITICGKMSFQDEYNDLGTEIKCLFLAPQVTPDNNKKNTNNQALTSSHGPRSLPADTDGAWAVMMSRRQRGNQEAHTCSRILSSDHRRPAVRCLEPQTWNETSGECWCAAVPVIDAPVCLSLLHPHLHHHRQVKRC